jgi:hypothetical protein
MASWSNIENKLDNAAASIGELLHINGTSMLHLLEMLLVLAI